jgi:hypothetical protein
MQTIKYLLLLVAVLSFAAVNIFAIINRCRHIDDKDLCITCCDVEYNAQINETLWNEDSYCGCQE